jgi:hypothetical protein
MRTATVLLFVAALVAGCSSSGGDGTHVAIPDAGQVFPNLTLQGLRSVATLDTEDTVSTWEDFDPDGLRYDLLHVMAICLWCPHCNNETTNIAQIAAWQADHHVAVLQIAIQGYSGASPTWPEIQKWAQDHDVSFPVLIDGQAAKLGQSFNVSSVPLNIMVNPRTMAVLAIDLGEVGDVEAYEQGFLNRP